MKKINLIVGFLKDVWSIAKEYWQSEEKNKACLVLTAIVALIVCLVYVDIKFYYWNQEFLNCLQVLTQEHISAEDYEKEKFTFLCKMGEYLVLSLVSLILSAANYYLRCILCFDWRNWLTKEWLVKWTENKRFYKLQMFGHDIDNPDQRISEDIATFINNCISYFCGIFDTILSLITASIILYGIKEANTVIFLGNKYIVPGYMLLLAIVYAVGGTIVAHLLGKKLVKLNFIKQHRESDFRFSLIRMRENAESVAFYDGEKQELDVCRKKFKLLLDNWINIIDKDLQLEIFKIVYSRLAAIFPYIVVITMVQGISYGLIGLIARTFSTMQNGLSYCINAYSGLAEWKAITDRLTTFAAQMVDVDKNSNEFGVERMDSQDCVELNNFEIALPDGNILLKNMHIKLESGHNVLVKGESGCGKSTLLRAISGIWPYVKGSINMPERKKLMFIPQKPYLPLGSLRETLLYPGNNNVTDNELIQLMEQCRIGYLADKLDIVADWSHVLSVGEQQRLAFVRVHIQKPIWLFLDESTSALDEETEAKMYELIGEKLKSTTIVSVGHRSTLKAYHTHELRIDKVTKTICFKESL